MGATPFKITMPMRLVLRCLLEEPIKRRYGLELGQAVGVPSGTLHPILSRLETAGWLNSTWEVADPHTAGRPRRRYYVLTPEGVEGARELLSNNASRREGESSRPFPSSGARRALLLASSLHDMPELPNLPHAASDVIELAKLLEDPRIGQFDDVQVRVEFTQAEGLRAVHEILNASQPGDLPLIYFAGHAATSGSSELLLLAKDSTTSPRGRGISASDLLYQFERTPANNAILVIDTCHSGRSHDLTEKLMGLAAPGRLVLTATRDHGADPSLASVWSKGLRKGMADIDGDGDIKVFEAFEYAHERWRELRETDSRIAMYGGGASTLVLAQSTRDEPRRATSRGLTGLSEAVIRDMQSPRRNERERAAWTLNGIACSSDGDERNRAILGLFELAQDDDEVVANIARLRWSREGESSGRQNWSQAITFVIEELHMSNDITILNGNGNKGNAVGRSNRVRYKELIPQEPILSPDDLRKALNALAMEVSEADLEWTEKTDTLAALRWWHEHASDAEEPDGAVPALSTLTRHGWVWQRFTSIMRALPDAVVAAWAVELIAHAMG